MIPCALPKEAPWPDGAVVLDKSIWDRDRLRNLAEAIHLRISADKFQMDKEETYDLIAELQDLAWVILHREQEEPTKNGRD